MDDLELLPLLLVGVGLLMIWGGISGENPVRRVRNILTRGSETTPVSTSSALTTSGSTTYTMRRDYLA